MGNCMLKEYGSQWAGEDWGSLVPETYFSGNTTRGKYCVKATDYYEQDNKALFVAAKYQKGGDQKKPAAAGKTREVKIKITKKQLEELLGRMDRVKGLSVARLMRASRCDRLETHQQSWRPALQSIPEVN